MIEWYEALFLISGIGLIGWLLTMFKIFGIFPFHRKEEVKDK